MLKFRHLVVRELWPLNSSISSRWPTPIISNLPVEPEEAKDSQLMHTVQICRKARAEADLPKRPIWTFLAPTRHHQPSLKTPLIWKTISGLSKTPLVSKPASALKRLTLKIWMEQRNRPQSTTKLSQWCLWTSPLQTRARRHSKENGAISPCI